MVLHINSQTDMLAVIDVQNDFLPGGSLAVPNSDQIIPVINRLLASLKCRSFATQDWHPQHHISFVENYSGKSPFEDIEVSYGKQTLWPAHATQNTDGAELFPNLQKEYFQMILRKGFNLNIDSYSAFYENDHQTSTGLDGWLHSLGIKRIFFTGLAENFCVKYSAIDAIKSGFDAYIIQDATKHVIVENDKNGDKCREELKNLGIRYLSSQELFSQHSI